jgi:hypothetical protein
MLAGFLLDEASALLLGELVVHQLLTGVLLFSVSM